jgi:hypothetical protein
MAKKDGKGKAEYIDILKRRFNYAKFTSTHAKKFSAIERAYQEDMLDARNRLVNLGVKIPHTGYIKHAKKGKR